MIFKKRLKITTFQTVLKGIFSFDDEYFIWQGLHAHLFPAKISFYWSMNSEVL